MDCRTIKIRTWHLVLVVLVATGIVAATLAIAASSAAERPVTAGVPLSAPAHEPIPAYPAYSGWGQVAGFGYRAGLVAPRPVVAWQWYDRYGWIQRGRTPGTRVYVYPYASGWSWTWTESTGWYAMRTSDLTIGYRPIAIAT